MNENDWIYELKKQRVRQYWDGKLFHQSEIGKWYDATKRRYKWARLTTETTKLLSGIEPQFWIPYEPLDDDIPY